MSLCDIENKAKICRITCGWKKPELPIDWVRLYWRDVHSPAISRRLGIFDYRHYQYDNVIENLLSHIDDISYSCDINEQLMWTSDVRYKSEQDLSLFDSSPIDEAKKALLGDIDLIVDKSTTYRAVNSNAHTFIDISKTSTPQGSYNLPTFVLFLKKKSKEEEFRNFLNSLSLNLSGHNGVIRLRLSLFDEPDMDKEKKAGYPIKTHPKEQQYQASIELVLDKFERGKELFTDINESLAKEHIKEIHTYPVRAVYTSIYASKPTIVGLRGYPAYQAIKALNADNQKNPFLLEWMYGDIAKEFND
ncbi:MAG: hypothetical protein VX397_00350 [Pseudomonadota bacterium]|nr:hypothetical protein [Pseudomonadota bacterium]